MTQLQLLDDLAVIGVGILFWVCAVFPILIAIVWPWWQSWWGRNIASLEISLAVAFLPSILKLEFGVVPNTFLFGWLVVAAVFSAATIVIWRGVMIFLAQRRAVMKKMNKDDYQ